MPPRERRSWTPEEDQLLREAIQSEDPDNPKPSKWCAIAKHVPNRTNKDCRKRWFIKMSSNLVKGGWTLEEDEKLTQVVEKYGTRWSLVASFISTRNSDQCAKRWRDALNPDINRTAWTPEADGLLLDAVEKHGKVWTRIAKTYFPGRTGLSAKNRYNSIIRSNSYCDKTPILPGHRGDHQESSSSILNLTSSCVLPLTPSFTVADAPHSPFASATDFVPESYLIDNVANWPESSLPMKTIRDWISFFLFTGWDINGSSTDAKAVPIQPGISFFPLGHKPTQSLPSLLTNRSLYPSNLGVTNLADGPQAVPRISFFSSGNQGIMPTQLVSLPTNQSFEPLSISHMTDQLNDHFRHAKYTIDGSESYPSMVNSEVHDLYLPCTARFPTNNFPNSMLLSNSPQVAGNTQMEY